MEILLRLIFVTGSAILLGFFFHAAIANRIIAIIMAVVLSAVFPFDWFRKKKFPGLAVFIPLTCGCALFFSYLGTFMYIDIVETDWTGTVGPELMAFMPLMLYVLAIIFAIPACVGYIRYNRRTLRKTQT